MDVDADLYDRDFLAWTRAQAKGLRAAATTRSNLPIDWEHVAAEIEDLGKRDRRDLESRVETIIVHLLKLQYSPAEEPRGGWMDTIAEARSNAQLVLRDSPSLRRELGGVIVTASEGAKRRAEHSLRVHGETEAADLISAAGAFTDDQVLGVWYPERAGAPGKARRSEVRSRSRRS